jgi:glycosyltransferase involved in cell wall biosynthesis
MDVSIVIPVYNEEECAPLLVERLHGVLSAQSFSYEAILVDDGSRDATWARLTEAVRGKPGFVLIRFRRNFGQTAAMSAGIDRARGATIVTLDADLQNDPADIPRLLAAMTPEVDVVSGWRKDRKDPFLNRRLPSMLANGLISRITGVALHDYGCTLKAYRAEVIKNVRLYGEMHRFIPALASWVGGQVREVVVTHHPRRHGTSKYGISRTLRVVLDLITVKYLLRYSLGPMQAFGKVGATIGVPGFLLLFGMIASHLVWLALGAPDQGVWYALALGIKRPIWVLGAFSLMLMGVQFLCIGLLAEVMTRIYHESQSKPTYVVRETVESTGA